jgi:hypothetical protein
MPAKLRGASRRLALLLLAIALVPAAARAASLPTAHAAATCADYPNQAAAQGAADTRDDDGDGIYCEVLPCPCLKPGQSGGGSNPSTPSHGQSTSPRSLGRSITLHRVTKTSGCGIHRPLPDARCTPAAYFSKATKAKICVPGYSKRVRNVPQSEKNDIYAAYGMTKHFSGRTGEVDHLISLELGGSNIKANLFPEAASPRPGAHEKDRLANALHAGVCAGTMTLRSAQRAIARNWLAEYHKLTLG